MASDAIADQTKFVLDDQEWEQFCTVLNRQAAPIESTRQLLTQASTLDAKYEINSEGPPLIEESFNTTKFDCGVESLNLYLKKFALQEKIHSSARTYVILKNTKDVVGYFTLAYGAVEHSVTPPKREGIDRYPVPIMLLTRLAVDISCQQTGMGSTLLKHALLKTLNAVAVAGLKAIVVYAKDTNTNRFYEKFGFSPSPLDSFHPFLILKDIQKA